MATNYNENDINSILEYSSLLVDKTFFDVINEAELDEETKIQLIEKYNRTNYKGGLGILLEELYFGYKANSNQMPDFANVGIELKSSPYEYKSDGTLRACERLSITMVPHDRPIENRFYYSDVWHKIQRLLLIYYLRDKNLDSRLEYHIGYSYLYSPTGQDLKIIIDDFNKIVNKVLNGKAHEISESDTLYLGACTKGASAIKSTQPQYYGDHIPAKARNFCFKQSYMTHILNNYIVPNVPTCEYESILKEEDLKEETFEDFVQKKINMHIGKTDELLCKMFGREYNNNKAQWVDLAYRMLGIKSNNAEEFVKANIAVKTIRLEQNDTIKECMSFATFKFKKLILENWEDSDLNNYFSETRFLFVIFKSNGKNYVLKGCKFWNMPLNDLNNTVKNSWESVVRTINNGLELEIKTRKDGTKYVKNNFLKESDDRIIHVRPKANKSYYKFLDGSIVGSGKPYDANELPDGTLMTTQCFWLNDKYVLAQIKDLIKS